MILRPSFKITTRINPTDSSPGSGTPITPMALRPVCHQCMAVVSTWETPTACDTKRDAGIRWMKCRPRSTNLSQHLSTVMKHTITASHTAGQHTLATHTPFTPFLRPVSLKRRDLNRTSFLLWGLEALGIFAAMESMHEVRFSHHLWHRFVFHFFPPKYLAASFFRILSFFRG